MLVRRYARSVAISCGLLISVLCSRSKLFGPIGAARANAQVAWMPIATIRYGNVDLVHAFAIQARGKTENVLAVDLHAQLLDGVLDGALLQKRIVRAAGRLRQRLQVVGLAEPGQLVEDREVMGLGRRGQLSRSGSE